MKSSPRIISNTSIYCVILQFYISITVRIRSAECTYFYFRPSMHWPSHACLQGFLRPPMSQWRIYRRETARLYIVTKTTLNLKAEKRRHPPGLASRAALPPQRSRTHAPSRNGHVTIRPLSASQSQPERWAARRPPDDGAQCNGVEINTLHYPPNKWTKQHREKKNSFIGHIPLTAMSPHSSATHTRTRSHSRSPRHSTHTRHSSETSSNDMPLLVSNSNLSLARAYKNCATLRYIYPQWDMVA